MSSSRRVVALPGDGIGPEIVAAAIRVVDEVAAIEWEEYPIGGASIDRYGTALIEEVIGVCQRSDGVLLGAVGGPKWDEAVALDPGAPRPEQGLLGIRKALGLFANLRPVRPQAALVDASPLRPELIAGTDLLVVRELTGGIYFGESGRREGGDVAFDECAYSVGEIERIARVAFEAATGREGQVTSVDKANVLETSRLWRETVSRVAGEFPEVSLDHLLVDNAAMQLVARPSDFDVILSENLFGDILSDESAMLTGSLGMLPSASLGDGTGPGLFEPVHGSAPDIAGTDSANPLATMLSAAMLLRHGLDDDAGAKSIESAVDEVLADGLRTADIHAGAEDETLVGTAEITEAVIQRL